MQRMLKRAFRKTKVILNTIVGRELIVRPQYTCNTERFGSDYGGWTLCIDGICKNSTIYSLGVGYDISFDIDLIRRFDVTIHAFDPTPSSIEWIGKQKMPKQFVMHPIAISDFNGIGAFMPPVDPKYFSHTLSRNPGTQEHTLSVPVSRLVSIMDSLGHQEIDLLKMDIEGAEYQVIADLLVSGIRPRQILVEFHHRFPDIGLPKTRVALQQLSEMGYRLFALSDNHQEYSFIRPALI